GCSGVLNGSTYTTGAITSACTVSATFALNSYSVTSSASAGGMISPPSVSVTHGDATTFTVQPDAEQRVASVTGCGGTLSGTVYTTATVTEDCAVSVRFVGVAPGFDPAAPAPVDVLATSLLTALPSNIAPTAVDYRGNVVPVTLVERQSHYAPGRHVLRWRAVDDRGDASTVEQVLRVWPTVSVGKDVTIGATAGTFGSFRIALNGVSPSYPFDVSYEVQGAVPGLDLASGSVRFAEGEIEKDVFFALTRAASDQTVIVRLVGDSNFGRRSSLFVSVVSRNEPGVVSFTGTQDGESRLVFGRDGGPVTLTATVDDPNSTDIYSYQWRYPTQAVATVNAERLTLQPASLSPGIHRIELSVTDRSSAPLVSTGVIDIVIRETAPVLPAGVVAWNRNGLPSDPTYSPAARNVVPAIYGDTDRLLLEADGGVQLSLGAYASSRSNLGAQLLSLSEVGLREDGIVNVGGYFDFVVSDLQRAGQSVNVVLPQRQALRENSMYRKWNSRLGVWLAFVSDTANSLASAPGSEGNCPPPDSPAYRAGLNVGDWCVRMTLQDGGPNDDDGQRNGSISDPGGIASYNQVTTSAPTLRKGGAGSTDPWLLLLPACLLLIAGRARRTAHVRSWRHD
ncbi:MAG TPA: choice-of-anchor U domain-containing protein, partial [Steroidobacter sp.]